MNEHIHVPADPRVFVFGSNIRGIHGAGAAAYAYRSLGARMGVGLGRTGRCYALPTCSAPGVPLPIERIAQFVDQFLEHARVSPDTCFFVSEVGCGLAGFTADQIAPMFRGAPGNCTLPPGWPE